MNLTIKQYLLLSLLVLLTHQQQCHYSCQDCVAPYYTYCLSCSDPSNSLTVLEDPAEFEPEFRHSIYKSGICTGKVPTGPNGLGVILLVVSVPALLLTQSFQAFFILSTLQTLSLFGLLEVAWVGVGSYILQSFQQFMPINLIVGNLNHNDHRLLKYGFYRLDQYIRNPQNVGLIAIFAIDSALFIAIIVIFVFTFLRKDASKSKKSRYVKEELMEREKQQNQSQLIPQMSNQSQRFQQHQNPSEIDQNIKRNQGEEKPEKRGHLMETLCEKIEQCLVLRKVLHIVIYVFFFFVQETALSIMVRAVFKIEIVDVIIWAIYFIQVVTVLVISFYELEVDKKLNPGQKKTHEFGLSLFMSRSCMFLVVLKKIILPLGVVLPLNLQFIFFIMYLVIFLIEGTLDSKSKRMACISRLGLWKLLQMLITILILSFYFNQKKGSLNSNANTINIILSILLLAFLVSLMVEFTVSFIAQFISTGKSNQIENQSNQAVQNPNIIQLNNTELTLNEDEAANQNIFQHIQITRENTDQIQQHIPKQNLYPIETQDKNQIKIQEIQDAQIQPIQPPRKQSQLVVSKARINDRGLSYGEQDHGRNNKQMTEKSNSTKIDKSQLDERDLKSANPKIEPQFNEEDTAQKTNDDAGEKEEENGQKKRQKKQVLNAELRKIYGIR